ncbi:hypothetical protein SESBI_12608 [Sesbania bispinosa]|nr:hypothetical protein SESBI_12608 [Sesbania bispinosa]
MHSTGGLGCSSRVGGSVSTQPLVENSFPEDTQGNNMNTIGESEDNVHTENMMIVEESSTRRTPHEEQRQMSHCTQHVHHNRSRRGAHRQSTSNNPNASQLQMPIICERNDEDIIVLAPTENFLVEYKCTMTLEKACIELNIPQPMYKARPSMNLGGSLHYAYRATLRSPLIGDPHYCVGAYAPIEDLAQEDVARKLLRRLVVATGKQVLDFNYHRVAELEDKVRSISLHNAELKMENG